MAALAASGRSSYLGVAIEVAMAFQGIHQVGQR